MANKIQKNDEIIVLTGKDKGKIGIVKSVFPNKVIISGINLVKKHLKSDPSKNQVGGIIKKESKLHISNIAIFNSTTKKRDRVGFLIKDGKKIRVFKSNKKCIKSL